MAATGRDAPIEADPRDPEAIDDLHATVAGSRPGRGAVAVVVGAFVLSRLAYAAAGVRFQWEHAPSYLHFIEPDLLRDHLLQSLWYDHAQPPGLNLLWGVVLKVAPDHPDRILWPLFLVVGLVTALVLQRLLVRVGLTRRWASALAALWTISPTAVTLESYLLYTPFEVLGVLAIALLVARWTERGRSCDAVGVLAVASALALTRSTFHLVWVLALVALLGAVRRDRWRVPAVAAVLPLVLVGGLYAKNEVLFGRFGPSSWLGSSLSRVTVEQLPMAERRALSRDGVLSPYAPFPAFASFADMGVRPPAGPSVGEGVPLLDRGRRTASPFPNQRQRGYLVVDDARRADALWVLRHRPGAYARGLSRSASVAFALPSDFFGYGPNAAHLRGPVDVERWLLGGWSATPPVGSPALGGWTTGGHEWVVLAAYLVALGAVPVRLFRRRAWRETSPADALALAAWATTAYLTILTIALDFGENNRFRSVTDPAVIVLLAWLIAGRRSSSEAPVRART